ncbi:GHKL domain-containing protein [Clostridium felsineum]|nr:GHKL domain-containing protein [Clostridium felsineum]URZ00447.1 hypothetical protein CLAUR_004350 [Clostridium felsineum]
MSETQIFVNFIITTTLIITIRYYFYNKFLEFSNKKMVYLFFLLEIIVSIISRTSNNSSNFKIVFIFIFFEFIISSITCSAKPLVKLYTVILIETIMILISLTFFIIDFKLYPILNGLFIKIGYYKVLNTILINLGDILKEVILFLLLKAISSVLKIKDHKLDLYKQFQLIIPCAAIYGISLIFYNIQIINIGKTKYYLPKIFTNTYYLLTLISVFLIISIFISAYTFQKMLEYDRENEKNSLMKQQLNLQFEHNRNIQKLYRSTRGTMHDINKHINCLNLLAYSGDIDALKKYLNNISETIKKLDSYIKTGNVVADAVINEKYTIASNEGIEFKCDFTVPENIKIEPIDLSSILNNTLDNSIEACRRIKNKKLVKFVSIKSIVKNSFLIIEVSNTTDIGIKYIKNNIISAKNTNNHGIGIYNIKFALKKYNGTFDIKEEKNKVTVNMMIKI